MAARKEPIWIARDFVKCSGCRRCEISCSLLHENRIWPETSRIRVFMLVPGTDFPHFCTQCEDYPCVKACPVGALSTSSETGAVLVNNDTCTGCGQCIDACPGRIPHLHPDKKLILICDLCNGDPECVKTCQEAGFGVLKVVPKTYYAYRVYARKPEETAKDLAIKLYGEKGREFY